MLCSCTFHPHMIQPNTIYCIPTLLHSRVYHPLTLNLTSCKFYLILMSLSLIYDPHPPPHTESSPPSDFNFIILQKIEYSDIFRFRSGYRQRTEFLKTDSESLFPDGYGHIFNFCLAPSWGEKTRLENGGTDPRGFAAPETGFWCDKTSRIGTAVF
jgi:hypothetical protein